MWPIYPIRFHHRFFFFQAEDGIRDHCVTGVQTCALPILSLRLVANSAHFLHTHLVRGGSLMFEPTTRRQFSSLLARSEERRVGKECRYRWLPDHRKKNVMLHGCSTKVSTSIATVSTIICY